MIFNSVMKKSEFVRYPDYSKILYSKTKNEGAAVNYVAKKNAWVLVEPDTAAQVYVDGVRLYYAEAVAFFPLKRGQTLKVHTSASSSSGVEVTVYGTL